MAAYPDGSVTFLFSDIEGSTRTLGQRPALYAAALLRHDVIMRGAVERASGVIFETVGDAVYAAFADPVAAVAAALDAQLGLAREDWGALGAIRVRIGIHGGAVERRGDHYFGAPLYRCARLTSIGHGGQTLLSETIAEAVTGALPQPAGLRPMGTHRLKDLAEPEVVFQLTHPDLLSQFAPLRSLAPATNTLPTQLTSLVGRRRELDETARLLATTRLLSFTGPGGTGKTRLAIALAAEAVGSFDDGVVFVPLAATRDVSLVATAIALALEVTEQPAEPLATTIAMVLRPKELLLLLDNFEQVIEAAPLVARLLADCSRLKIVATSRVRLNVSGEQRYEVPPLAISPQPRSNSENEAAQPEAVTLFLQRALAVKPDLPLTKADIKAIVDICVRLDGLPLAIELAAARVKTLPPQAMLSRLTKRLTVLSGGARDLPERQRTLRGTIDWSHELLTAAERTLFRRLAVFAGGFALDHAGTIGGDGATDVLDGIERLVDHSLLRERAQPDGQPRFEMLETIREYARERLTEGDDADEIERQHAALFLALAERAEPELIGADRRRWLDRLEAEHENFRAALDWSLNGGAVEVALRLAAALWRFWQMRGHLAEGERWLRKVLALPAAGQSRARVRALTAAGGIAYWQEDIETARSHYASSVAAGRELNDSALVAEGLYNLSFTVPAASGERRSVLEECVALYRQLGDERGVANSLLATGGLLYDMGSFAEAEDALNEGLAIAESLGDLFTSAGMLHMLGNLAESRGDAGTAESRLHASLELAARAGDLSAIAIVVGDLSRLALRGGRVEPGARLAGAAAAMRKVTGVERLSPYETFHGPSAALDLTDPLIGAAWSEGQRMDPQEAVAYALARDL
ncbi:MAG: adenylate/guanylate cyclase domain-containing protein [Chloroflexota bacterium]|nr:adenylate/guanylate cyclase domain-containing protein [Chloroflexota bacterium]